MDEERSLVRNAADEEQVREARKKEKRRSERDEQDILHVIAERPGRRLLWRFISDCGVFQSNPVGNLFQEGRRDVGLKILAELMAAAPETYIQMMKEARDDDAR